MRTPFRPALTLAAAAALLVAACSERTGLRDTRPDEASDARRPSFAIADATNSGRAGFYFLTPLVPSLPSYPGTFDPAVAASARICPAPVASCASPIATFTTGGGGLTVDAARQAYVAAWPVPAGLTLGTGNYRLEVRAAGTTLGFADLNVVAAPAPSVPGHVNAVRGGTLTIRFRIETGMVGAVTVAPPSASVAVGGTQAFTATVTDLHGAAIASPAVAWQSANPGVATVSPSAGAATTATGVADGSTFIVATSNGVSGQATLAVSSDAAPVAQADAYQANAGSAITVPAGAGLLANDSRGTPLATVAGFGGGALGGAVTTNAAGATVIFGTGGSLTVQADGTLSFTPAAGFTGDFVFHYRLTNAAGSSDATVTIGVVRVPSAVNDGYTSPLAGPLVVAAPGVMANDDRGVPQAAVASFGGGSLGGTAATNAAGASVSDGQGGTIQLDANGALTHTPSGTFAGTITFQYRLTNAVGSSDATVTITVPQAPSAVADAYSATLAGTLTVPANGVLANDALGSPAATITHFGGGSLGGAVTANAVGTTATFGSGGSLQLNADGSLTFTRSAGFSGTFTFVYRLANPHATSDAVVTITVPRVPDAVNDAPAGASAPGQPFHTALNTPLVIPAAASPSLLGNDDRGVPQASVTRFGGGSLGGAVDDHAAGATAPFGTGGSLSIAADGAVTFTPPTNFTGLFTAQYRLANVHGSDVATLTIAVGARPAAANDAYAPKLLGNVSIATATSTGFTVATNDQGDQLTFAVVPGSALHGTAALLPGGTFTFNPERGYEGAASFQYQITNGFGSATATVSLTIEKMVWFIDDGAPAGGDGRFLSQYNSLAAFQAANGAAGGADPDNQDGIFLYAGSYTGPVTLRPGQRLIGQGVTTGTAASHLGVTWPADAPTPPSVNGARPAITSGADGVVLGSGNTLKGVALGNATGSALAGTGFGTLTTADVAINTSGRAIALATGTVDGDFAQVRSTDGANNVALTAVATVGTTDLGTAADALSGADGDALRIAASTGSFAYPGAIAGGAGAAVALVGGSATLTLGGSVSQANAFPLVAATGGHTGTLRATGQLSATNGTGLQFDNADGTYDLDGVAPASSLAGGDAAVDIVNGSAGTFTFGANLSVASPSGTAFLVDGSAATVTMKGPITQGAARRGVLLQSNTGGSTTFTGVLALSTTTANAFEATSGALAGTVTVQSATTNALATTTGTALRVSNVNIGAGGLTFRSISANGAATGIVLNNTGAGSLTVAGNGAAGTGGTIQFAGTAVSLTNTAAPSLSWMQLTSSSAWAIKGAGVAGLSLDRLTINGTNGTDAGLDHGSVHLTNTTGAASITSSTIQGGLEDNLTIVQTTGTLDRLTLDNVTVGPNSLTLGEDGVSLDVTGGRANVTIRNSAFTSARARLVNAIVQGSGASDLVIQNSAFSNNQPNQVSNAQAIVLAVGGSGAMTYAVTGNTVRDSKGTALFAGKQFGGGLGNGTMTGTIASNTIGVAGVANSGSLAGSGIEVLVAATGAHTALVRNNTIRQYNAQGILVTAGIGVTPVAEDAALNVTIQGNTIAEPGTTTPPSASRNGIQLNSGVDPADAYRVCLNLGDPSDAAKRNTVTGSGADPAGLGNGSDIRLRQRQNTVVGLPGYAGAATNAGGTLVANLTTYLTPRPTGAFTLQATAQSTGFQNTIGGIPCATP